MEFTKINNGHVLVLVVDKDHIFSILDDCIRLCDEVIEEIKNDPDADIRALMRDAELPYEEVYQDYGEDREYTLEDVEKVKAEYEDAKNVVEEYIADDAAKLWDEVSLKKNGTFKKNAKPTIFEHGYGDYWEDSYGWNCTVIRLESCSDTKCELVVTDIVRHY